jgi:hypothetical protein
MARLESFDGAAPVSFGDDSGEHTAPDPFDPRADGCVVASVVGVGEWRTEQQVTLLCEALVVALDAPRAALPL